MKLKKKVELKVSNDKNVVEVRLPELASGYNSVVSVNGERGTPESVKGNCITLNLVEHSDFEVSNKLSILRGVDHVKPYGEIEIIKKSEVFLKRKYNVSVPGGRLVIGYCTFNLSSSVCDEYKKIGFHDIQGGQKEYILRLIEEVYPQSLELLLKVTNEDLEILNKTEAITRFLWKIYTRTGPSDIMKAKGLSVYEKLLLIKDKGGTVQCAGTRDLFIALARLFIPSLQMRKVDAYRYYPFFPNIVVNGHSILEIKKGDDWFLFDPFVRVYFKNKKNDSLCSAADLKLYWTEKRLNELSVHHVETPPHPKREDFDSPNIAFDPHEYNYFSHFNFLRYFILNNKR